MNLKKILISLSIISIFVVALFSQSAVYAEVAQTPIYLGITEQLNSSDMGYAIGVPGEEGASKIWKIVKYSTETSNDPTKTNAYCVKAGYGFSDTNKRQTYNVFYNMKTERQTIANDVSVMAEVVNGTITEDGTNINRYDALLAAIDMLYLPGESDESEKTELINNIIEFAKQPTSGYTSYVGLMQQYPLTDDDIIAVQQAALWYFTNYDGVDGKYDKTSDTNWLNYTLNGTDYATLSSYNPNGLQVQYDEGQARSYQAEILYNSIIKTAKENASKYSSSGTATEVPATLNTTKLEYTESGDNYIVGPINITETQGNTTYYSIDFIVKNNNSEISYALLDENQSAVAEGTTVKDLVGNDFYISVPKSSLTSLSVTIDIKYKNTTMTLWASNQTDSEQPVVIPKKENVTNPIVLTLTPEDQKTFDLALRKYITKINGTELTSTNSRVPNIDENPLQSGTTATYKHRKDPVIVENGNTVTYKLTIYNEGEQAGRATKIVDQLPTGLKFVSVVSGNFEPDTSKATNGYDIANNTLYLTRKSGNETNLPAYTAGNLAANSETIEIECEVTEAPDSKVNKILTNVAWISEAIDEEGNSITNQSNMDRDSEPSTTPKINNVDVNKDNMSNYTGDSDNKDDLTDSAYYYKGSQDDDDFEKLVILPEAFDLKLIKRITAVNNQNVPERIENVDVSKLNTLNENGQMIKTGEYTLNKEPVSVANGDIVTYTFRIYNEGMLDGYAQEITEDIPEGLEFLWSEKTGDELAADTTLSDEEKEAIEFNQTYLWGNFVYNDSRDKIIKVSTDYLSDENETTVGGNLIKAFGKNDGTKTESDISYKEVSIKLKVIADNLSETSIRNEACISEDADKSGNSVEDRDSDPNEWNKENSGNYYDENQKWPIYEEDDEDYDNIVLKSFDLALRKFIIAVSKDETIENSEYLKNTDGSYTRAPKVDTSKLNTLGENGKTITTAIYNHSKEPVEVSRNDIVVYMLRVYNEGELDGYAAQITDHLPSYLEFVDGEFNKQYGWTPVSGDGRTVTTNYLENQKIAKAVLNENEAESSENRYTLSYREVPIMCKVKSDAKADEKITNIAEITESLDENKKPVTDRDSKDNDVNLPKDSNLPSYKDDETGEYIPGQYDDDDFEKVIVKKFDLALRKFITAIGDNQVTSRVPQVKYENGKITYEHSKDPLQVVTNQVVTYTIRVFNEGEVAGYATEITDDIPEGLEFLPDNELNKTMRWKMIDADGKETTEVSKAVKITTDYLSKDQEKSEYSNLLNAFDKNAGIVTEGENLNPDYKDVQVAFKVTEANSSDKIIINSAQISEDSDKEGDPIDDEDSVPGKWNEGEDDQDKEYIKLVEFDLALRKWVTQAIVIEDGKQTVTNTGHQPYDDPEQVVKVELNRKKLSSLQVKFKYSIRVINEGDIEGYAKEITDYVPEGLKFVASDNPGWTDEGNNVISTRLLENTLLKPGEYADLEVILTWENNKDNMGLKTNTAEISEDDNEYDVPDRDSTPDNKKKGEDDIDDAPVMLSITTGKVKTYFTLGFVILITLAGGVILIKKFVL